MRSDSIDSSAIERRDRSKSDACGADRPIDRPADRPTGRRASRHTGWRSFETPTTTCGMSLQENLSSAFLKCTIESYTTGAHTRRCMSLNIQGPVSVTLTVNTIDVNEYACVVNLVIRIQHVAEKDVKFIGSAQRWSVSAPPSGGVYRLHPTVECIGSVQRWSV